MLKMGRVPKHCRFCAKRFYKLKHKLEKPQESAEEKET
jgi:hypothetical protein